MPADSKHCARTRSGRNIVRWIFEFAVLAIMLCLVYAAARYTLPKIAIGQLSELTSTKIEAKSVSFDPNGSVFIKGLVVRPYRSQRYDNSILRARSVHAQFSLASVFLLRPRLKEIWVSDFELNIQHDLDRDEWNVSALRLPPATSRKYKIPLVWLEKGKVLYSNVTQGRVRIATQDSVSASFRPAPELLGGYSFSITTTPKQSFEKSSIVGLWVPGRIEIGGDISSRDLPGFDRPWTIKTIDARLRYDTQEKSYSLTVKIKDLFGLPDKSSRLFTFESKSAYQKFPVLFGLQSFFIRYRPSGRADMDFQASGHYDRLADSLLSGRVRCVDGAASDKNFPYPVEHITGRMDFTQSGVTFDNVKGRHGDVGINIGGWCADFGPDLKYEVQITSDNMLLDKDLYNALAPESQEFWSAFSPSGRVALNYSLSRRSPTDRSSAIAVELLETDGKYAGFAYPLDGARGFLFFDRDGMTFSNVVMQTNGRKISINGTVTGSQGKAGVCDILIKGRNIPLDSTLEQSLPADQKELYKHFGMSGLFDANIAVFTPEENNAGTTYRADVLFKQAFLGAGQSGLLLSDVTARAVITPDSIQIEEFTGRYGQGTVSVSGQLTPGADANGPGYCVTVTGEQLALDRNLFSVLPGPLAELSASLRPKGTIGFTANLNRAGGDDCPGNTLTVECLGDSFDCNALPYPLENIKGKIHLSENRIKFDRLTASAIHNIRGMTVPSSIKLTGELQLGADGADTNAPGGSSEGLGVRDGHIGFEAENFKLAGKTLRTAKASFDYQAGSGEWISKNLLANFYGGKMTGRLEMGVRGGTGGRFLLEAGFAGADLREFLSDKQSDPMPVDAYTTGRMSGSVSIIGRLSDNFLNIGRCQLDITDMQVGRLSLLAKLLGVLNLTEPTDYAFDKMLVDCFIKNNRVYFRELDLSGESLAFSGSGWMDLSDRNVNLTLTARGHRLATASPSILGSLTEGLGQAVVRIDITGDASDPQIKTETLPLIKGTLGLFGTKPAKKQQ